MTRTILHIDMDAYFASVEQVSNPSLKGKPIAVCGESPPSGENGEQRLPERTIITTASYEARKYGVKTAMTPFEAKRLCPVIIFVTGNLEKYIDTTLRIHKILLDFSDLVEPFSIDECFMDATGSIKLLGGGQAIASGIKKRIKEEIGITCSIGLGPNKIIAKLGSKRQKPDGLFAIEEKDVRSFLEKLKVEELQGIGVGRKISEKLRSIGINTAGELGSASGDMLMARFGILGYHLKNIGLGIDNSPVKKYSDTEQV